jgi:hypothetical protein
LVIGFITYLQIHKTVGGTTYHHRNNGRIVEGIPQKKIKLRDGRRAILSEM